MGGVGGCRREMSHSVGKVSVIIPVWNGRRYLPECLDALLAQRYPDLEVVVVDNASEDESAAFVAAQYPDVKLAQNDVNLGFAGACNVGFGEARGDVLVLLNQDTRVRPGWLAALVAALDAGGVGAVGCKIYYPDGRTLQHAGGGIEWPLGLAKHIAYGELDVGQYDEVTEVEYVTAAAVAFRRTTVDAIGPLDEGFGLGYFEDADYCYRIREAGLSVLYEPRATLLHDESSSVTDSRQRSLMYQRNRLRFVMKHMPPTQFVTDFVTAERGYMLKAMYGGERNALRVAYLSAALSATRLLRERWSADSSTCVTAVAALMELYEHAWGLELCDVSYAQPVHQPSGMDPLPELKEFQFRSRVPCLGRFITWLRSVSFRVGALYPVRSLIQQQAEVNRLLYTSVCRQANRLDAAMNQLVAERHLLVGEIVRVASSFDAEGGAEDEE